MVAAGWWECWGCWGRVTEEDLLQRIQTGTTIRITEDEGVVDEEIQPTVLHRDVQEGGKNKEINNKHKNIKLSRARAAKRPSNKTHEDKLLHSSVAEGKNPKTVQILIILFVSIPCWIQWPPRSITKIVSLPIFEKIQYWHSFHWGVC